MRSALSAFALWCWASPLTAQLTTSYTGFQRDGDREIPATARFSIESGRIAMIMTGTRSARMLFDAKARVLHMVSDDDKSYLDLQEGSGGDPTGMSEAMQKQLDALPKEQRAMAEQMMQSAMGAKRPAPPQVYVWSKEKKTIAGYECTRVDGMRGDTKVTEYCGTRSSDFKLSPAEHQTILAMQGYFRNFMISVRAPDDAIRAFQWDTSTDGYPVLTRCYKDGKVTLELQLASVKREPPADSLFVIPSDYKKMDLSKMGRP